VSSHDYTLAEVTQALLSLIAWTGNANAAVRALKAEGKVTPTAVTLTQWSRGKHADLYQRLHEEHAPALEAQLIGEFRLIARHATDAARLAIEKATDRLENDKDNDPARTAANLATVADKATGKVLALSGRPTSIREERRNPEELVRSLMMLGVIKADGEPLALPEASVEQQ
jgi:hypothetical protein